MESIEIFKPVEKKDHDARKVAALEHFKNTDEFLGGRYEFRCPGLKLGMIYFLTKLWL